MGQPVWQIRNSNLGTIAENIFFEFELEAIDTDAQPVSYSVVAGTLPEGIQVTGTAISGVPVKVTGVPADVDVDTSTQFAIRATSTTNEVSDITLDLTVSGQTVPEITTSSGSLGDYYYGDFIDVQLDAQDDDVANTLSWSVINNTLPDGLELVVDEEDDRIAYIRGYPVPATALPPGVVPGFDAQVFDADLSGFGFDFGLNSIDKNFEFVISITDGIGFDSSTFSLYLQSNLIFYNADSDTITADASIPTADATVSDGKIDPIMLTTEQDIGSFLHNNYFTFLFEGLDFEGDQIEFKEYLDLGETSKLPANLTLNPTTGWLHGTLDTITTTEELFTFRIATYKVSDPSFESDPVTFTMTVVSDLANSLVFNSPSIMTINNGEISELAILAEANTDADFNISADSTQVTADQSYPTADIDTSGGAIPIHLVYSLASGRLPIGLALTSTGLIVGRPSFNQFQLDEGETLFDDGETVWDGTDTFTVRIVDVTLGVIDVTEEFSIVVNPLNLEAYENLYLLSGPTVDERETYNTLINDSVIFPADSLYRDGDKYFGIAQDLRFLLVDGLAPASRTQYSIVLEKNHHTREFSFSELKIARAEGDSGDAIYELIYADVVDSFENNGESVGEELVVNGVDVSDLDERGATPQYNDNGSIIIRPASLENMRNIIISGEYARTADSDDFYADTIELTADQTTAAGIGQNNLDTLPNWMTTIQDNGRALGFIPAVPIAYCLPGEASQIMFDINQSGFDLNSISFGVDRYVWDNNLTNVDVNFYLELGDTEVSFNGIDPNGSFNGGNSVYRDYTGYTADSTSFRADALIPTADAIDIVGDLADQTADNTNLRADGLQPTADVRNTTYAVGETITLSNGATILIEAIDTFGDVSEFTITSIGANADTDTITADSDLFSTDMTTSIRSNAELQQGSSSGTGTGFTLRPIRQADEPDSGDELIKFPKVDVFQ